MKKLFTALLIVLLVGMEIQMGITARTWVAAETADEVKLNTIRDDLLQLNDLDGWLNANQTWTYASATTITVPTGAASIYSVGDKIKLTQTTVKYFYVVGVADTVLTVTGGSNYTVANAAITLPYYSHATSPVGFPKKFTYVPTVSGITIGSGTLVGYFSLTDGVVTYWVKLELAADTTMTGNPKISLPVATSLGEAHLGITSIHDTSPSSYYSGATYVDNSGMTVQCYQVSGTSLKETAITTTVPFTWATGDQIDVNGTYQVY
jgi:hypothetical protein